MHMAYVCKREREREREKESTYYYTCSVAVWWVVLEVGAPSTSATYLLRCIECTSQWYFLSILWCSQKWQWSRWRFSQIWLQAKYESKICWTYFLSFLLATLLETMYKTKYGVDSYFIFRKLIRFWLLIISRGGGDLLLASTFNFFNIAFFGYSFSQQKKAWHQPEKEDFC